MPAGILSTALPLTVLTSILPPMHASVNFMGISQYKSLPFLSKKESSATCITMYKSPHGPPSGPALPAPVFLRRVPVLTPAGTLIFSSKRSRTNPVPPQLLQGFSIILPVPPHLGHVCVKRIKPFEDVTCPRPLQVGHVFFSDPGSAPEPLQVLQCTSLLYFTVFSTPLTASCKVISRSKRKSSPATGSLDALPDEKPPPKNWSNMPPPEDTPPPNISLNKSKGS